MTYTFPQKTKDSMKNEELRKMTFSSQKIIEKKQVKGSKMKKMTYVALKPENKRLGRAEKNTAI